MNKILPVLMLTLFLFACGDDDNGSSGNGENNTIDKKLIGKWKVEYSKYSNSAKYNEETGEFVDNENAKIIEYFGNIGEPNVTVSTGMFDMKEYQIEIKEDNIIVVIISGSKPKTLSYIIKDGYLMWNGNTYRYNIDTGELTIELLRIGSGIGNGIAAIHKISRYSKIIE